MEVPKNLKICYHTIQEPTPRHVCMCVCLVAQLCLTLYNPMDLALQAPLSMGFFRQEYWLEWVAISSFRGPSRPRD